MQGADGYEVRLKKLEQAGASVLPEDQAIQFQRAVDSIARTSGITPTTVSAVTDSSDTGTSPFFVEKSLTMGFANTDESVLVDFLYNLGSGSSMFRVKELGLKPYAGGFKLEGKVTIIASYLRNPQNVAARITAQKPATSTPKPGAGATNAPKPTIPLPATSRLAPPRAATNSSNTRLTLPASTNSHLRNPPKTGASQ